MRGPGTERALSVPIIIDPRTDREGRGRPVRARPAVLGISRQLHPVSFGPALISALQARTKLQNNTRNPKMPPGVAIMRRTDLSPFCTRWLWPRTRFPRCELCNTVVSGTPRVMAGAAWGSYPGRTVFNVLQPLPPPTALAGTRLERSNFSPRHRDPRIWAKPCLGATPSAAVL